MGEKKVTIMVLKVDLQCHKCYKKVKKVLCKFPQIRDQIYDEKQNQVVIKVLCCNPEKIRDKICCKGGSAIKSIEIVKEPEKPPPAGKPKDDGKPKGDGKPKDDGKPKGDSKPKDDGKPKGDGKPKDDAKPKDDSKPKDDGKSKAGPPNPGPPPPQPSPCVPGYGLPVRACCMDCYQGHAGGPCYSGYGGGPAPYIQYDGYYGRPVYDSYGGGSKGYCEENPSSCIVM